MNQITYAVKHKDKDVVTQSRSGGIFTAVSDIVLLNNGIVYGCILDEQLHVIHIRAVSQKDRDFMRGSKYVQSKLGNTYKNVKKDLNGNKVVLFTGTSCQVAGLKAFLGKEYNNLLCIDIVCHGVPSPKLFEEYVKWNGTVKSIDFRNYDNQMIPIAITKK